MDSRETCLFVRNLIPEYLDGRCTEAESMFIKEHCAVCEECRALLHASGFSGAGMQSLSGSRKSAEELL